MQNFKIVLLVAMFAVGTIATPRILKHLLNHKYGSEPTIAATKAITFQPPVTKGTYIFWRLASRESNEGLW